MKAKRGCTLAEVIVAGGLATLALCTLASPLRQGRLSARQDQTRLEAVQVASQLVETARRQPFAQVSSGRGTISCASSRGGTLDFAYSLDVSESASDLKRLQLHLSWRDDGREGRLDFCACLRGEPQP